MAANAAKNGFSLYFPAFEYQYSPDANFTAILVCAENMIW